MQLIDEKFKDNTPEKTVERIQDILRSLGVTLEEKWYDSGLDNCFSISVMANGTFPSTHGKGVSPALARASGYGEFMERLQSGLFFYKYQSLELEPELFLHTYAPDAKYMTKQELIENGEWMDYLVKAYGGSLSREEIAEQCIMYAGSENVLTLPFYSLFEDKYVYLPANFTEHMYSANGCCVGNTREEAWIHALSEIMERRASIHMTLSGESAPEIPDEVLNSFKGVRDTIDRLRALDFDVKVLDFSMDYGFPIVATRIINKKTGGYMVDVGADPVFEIAVERTLTEVFQGKSIKTFDKYYTDTVLNKPTDVNQKHNVLNQLETVNGKFTVNFFTEELTAKREFKGFPDYSHKSNKELLPEILKMFRSFGHPVYVRNYSFLGFHCYKFILPGFSETRAVRLNEPLQEYYFADSSAKTLRYIENASDDALQELLLFVGMISGAQSRSMNYTYLSGLPLTLFTRESAYLMMVHLAYAAYRLHNTKELCILLERARKTAPDEETENYIFCLNRYFKLQSDGVPEEQAILLLQKFHTAKAFERLCAAMKNNTFFDGMLVRCDMKNCSTCSLRENCHLDTAKSIIRRAGAEYAKFTEGQSKEHFTFA